MGAALVAVCGRLIAEASPVAHGPQGVQASVAVPRGLCSTGSIVAVRQSAVFTTEPPGKPVLGL